MARVVLTGIKPTGSPHVGNYVGMIRPVQVLAEGADTVFLFIANYHALNSLRDSAELASYSYEIAATLLALGLERENVVLFRQSDVPETFELATILAAATPKGLMDRAHAYKAAVDRNAKEGREDVDAGVNMGLYTYPILMAADILLYGTDIVPVGRDQVQHVEFARDIAGHFNRLFGETFKLPAHQVREEAAAIPGLDGRKMSKSYGNVVHVFADEKTIRGEVMRIVTDSRLPAEPKDPDGIAVYQIYQALCGAGEAAAMGDRFRAGQIGYGDAKKMLADKVVTMFAEPARQYRRLIENRGEIDAALLRGAARARERAGAIMRVVRARVGV